MKTLDEYGKEFWEALKLNHEKVEQGEGDTYLSNLYVFLRDLTEIRINKEEKDAVIAMTGPKGEGKSNGSIFCTAILSYLLGANASLKENIIYQYQLADSTKRIVRSRKKPYTLDEAVDAAFNQDAIQRIYKFFAKVFIKGRKLCNVYFLNMPKMWMFGSLFRNDIIQFRIEIIKKFDSFALAALMAPDKNPLNPDPWFMDDDRKLFKKKTKATSYLQVMRILEKHPTFVCFLKIPKIPATLNKAYHEDSFSSLEAMADDAEELEKRAILTAKPAKTGI